MFSGEHHRPTDDTAITPVGTLQRRNPVGLFPSAVPILSDTLHTQVRRAPYSRPSTREKEVDQWMIGHISSGSHAIRNTGDAAGLSHATQHILG